MDDRAFTPRDVLSRIHAALKEPPAKLAAVIVSQSEQIKALGREYADVAELVTMAHEVAGAPPGGRASVSTVKIILYRPGPATRLPNGSEGIPTQFILRKILGGSRILISSEREGNSGRTGAQGGTLSSYIDIGIDYEGIYP